MKSVEALAAEIVRREGGYVDDPDDPGGATKYGVTIASFRQFGSDHTGDGRIDTADLRQMALSEAAQIFVEHYFRRPGLAMLPPCLQASVFDMYVNAGSNAVKILQRMLTAQGWTLVDDGQIGPRTAAAASAAARALGDEALANAYGIARRDYYYALADARPSSRKYARRRDGGKGGWITRAEEFISKSLWLSEAEHQRRVAKWA